MNQDNTANTLNYDEEQKMKLPTGLNVLTILTFIGCAIQLLGSLWSFFTAKKSYDGIDKVIEQMNSGNMPGWVKSMTGHPDTMRELMTKAYENRIPIVVLSVVAVALCFYGALQMRQLKKQGFLLYTIGELLPFLTQLLFIGAFAFSGMTMYFFIAITVLFILLYTMQRKHLVY